MGDTPIATASLAYKIKIMENKRTIEVFTAGCHVCQPTVDLVKGMACSSCEVTVYDLSNPCDTKECLEKLKTYGIKKLPAIAVNGKLLSCCEHKEISAEEIVNAGVGQAELI